MSSTNQICKFHSPSASGPTKRANWIWTEPFFNQIWFVAEACPTNVTGATSARTRKMFFLSKFEQVLQFWEPHTDQEYQLLWVNIATPGYVNGSHDWRVDRLGKVWSAIEPLMPSERTLVFETSAGDRFSCSRYDSATEDLRIESLIIELPNVQSAPAFERLRNQVEIAVQESGRPEGFDAGIWLNKWLNRPVGALGGRMPIEYMDSPEGVELISNLIGQMQHSTYA